jgi:ATP-dependent helicase/DNAse subunit B
MDPLERGSLIHRILERFFLRLKDDGRLPNLNSYSAADHQLLESIASECFSELERRGATGHPLVWENTSAAIRADLRTFLAKDEDWRRQQALQPVSFEQGFGMNGSGSWPLLELEVAGIRVSFRGSIDRIDLSASGQRGYLYDYKTGRSTSYLDTTDPVWAGKHVQLALYRQAMLAAIPELEQVGAAFWFITSKGEFKMVPIGEGGRAPDHRLLQVLEATATGILAGAFPQVPGGETARPGVVSWENCVYCDFDRICPAGRDAVWERKQATSGYELHNRLVVPQP